MCRPADLKRSGDLGNSTSSLEHEGGHAPRRFCSNRRFRFSAFDPWLDSMVMLVVLIGKVPPAVLISSLSHPRKMAGNGLDEDGALPRREEFRDTLVNPAGG